MSYAAPFSLLSFHLPDHDDSVAAERLTWPLAGSVLIHAVVFVAFLSLRFGSSLEQSSGSYEVTLVTLPEIAASATASPAKKSRPKGNADKVLPPKAKTAPQRKAVIPPSKAIRTTSSRPPVNPRVPQRVMDSLVSEPKLQVPAVPPKVVTPPVSVDPKPTLKQNVDKLSPPPRADVREVPKPERVTDSLMSALDSVVVPKPQAPALPQKSASVPPPVPAPVKQSSPVKMDVPPIQAPPQPPKLVVGKPEAPPPAPKVALLAPKLKQAVGATVVPKKPEQVSKRVSPTVASERKQEQGTPKASESPVITLPSRAPRLAAAAPPEMQKKETPLQTARKSSTVESLKEAIQSVRIPERNPKSKTPQPVKRAVPLVSETVPPAKAAEARNLQQRKFVSPSAPELAEVQDPVPFQPTVPVTASEPDTSPRQEIDVSIPDLLVFDAQPVPKPTGSGAEETRGLWMAGFCSQSSLYWENVEKKIDDIHKEYWKNIHRVESPAILTFRVMRNGQVADLDVVRSSGNKRFDSAARDAVLAAVPLPAFPANMTKPSCQVQHVFRATLNR